MTGGRYLTDEEIADETIRGPSLPLLPGAIPAANGRRVPITREPGVARPVTDVTPVEPASLLQRTRRRALSTVTPRQVRWLDPGLIPLGSLTLCAGVGGLGKSTWLAAVAARTTTGDLLGEPADVLLVSFEDTAAEVLRPRVEAAGGDATRVHEVYVPLEDGGPLSLPTDLHGLARDVTDTGAKLIVVDPIVAAIDVELDAFKDQHVRTVLAELTAIAEAAGAAAAIVGHLNKTPSRDAYIRVANSVAFYNAARSVVLITADPQEPEQHRLVSQVKANYARLRPVQRHVLEEIVLEHIDAASGDRVVTSRMRFLEDADDVDRNDVLAEHRDRAGADEKLTAAVVFLINALDDRDWHDSAGLKTLAGATGISERTLQRAAQELDLELDRRGFPATTWWRLRSRATPSPQDAGATGATGANPHGYAESAEHGSQSRHGSIGDRNVARLESAEEP